LDFETGQSKISYVPIAHPARLGDADLQEAVAQAASGASRKWRKPQVAQTASGTTVQKSSTGEFGG